MAKDRYRGRLLAPHPTNRFEAHIRSLRESVRATLCALNVTRNPGGTPFSVRINGFVSLPHPEK